MKEKPHFFQDVLFLSKTDGSTLERGEREDKVIWKKGASFTFYLFFTYLSRLLNKNTSVPTGGRRERKRIVD